MFVVTCCYWFTNIHISNKQTPNNNKEKENEKAGKFEFNYEKKGLNKQRKITILPCPESPG